MVWELSIWSLALLPDRVKKPRRRAHGILGCGKGTRAGQAGGHQKNTPWSSAFSLAQTPSLLPALEVGTGSTHPVEAALEEGSLEEVAPPMLQGNGPGAPQALDSTDLDVPTEAVTRES